MSYQQFGRVDPEERLDHVEEVPLDEEYPQRRLLPAVALGAGVIALFVGGLWFAYHQGTKHASVTTTVASTAGGSGSNEQVPLIRASADPVKVKPKDAGGMTLGDRDDPIYAMRPNGAQAEHILPPPEPPAPRPTAPPPPPPPPQIAAVPPPQALAAPLPAPPQAGTPAKPAAKPGPDAAAKPAPDAKPAAAGPPTKVQLASLRTPDEARDEWARLKRDNADLLGKFTAVAVKADLGERGIWYRVEAGPVGDRTAAIKLCKALKERDLGCQLVQ
jgi:hypothetical protein